VLEIGTGQRLLRACLAKRAREVLSVDIHPDFVENAAKTLKALGLKNVKLETRDGTRLDWLEQRYDVIVVTGFCQPPSFPESAVTGCATTTGIRASCAPRRASAAGDRQARRARPAVPASGHHGAFHTPASCRQG